MNQFWYTVAGRRFIEGTMPQIERNLDRIATALEKMVAGDCFTPDSRRSCEWCDHRHSPTDRCLVDFCECVHFPHCL